MITLHHLENSRSHRILWLLEELGCEYRIKHYKRDSKTNLAPPELKKVHPLGKSPVITEGKQTLAESAIIVEYLARTHGDTQWAYFRRGAHHVLRRRRLPPPYAPQELPLELGQ